MNIQINKILAYTDALNIAKKNSHFFNPSGLKMMVEDFKTGILFGAYYEQNLVGFIYFKEINDQVIELGWMAVELKLQGRGIGTLLVNEGLKLISNKYIICEMKTLSEIDPDPGYTRTRNFYKKLGFIPLETVTPYKDWGKDNPCQFFIKILKNEESTTCQ